MDPDCACWVNVRHFVMCYVSIIIRFNSFEAACGTCGILVLQIWHVDPCFPSVPDFLI